MFTAETTIWSSLIISNKHHRFPMKLPLMGQGVIRARKSRSHVHTETFFEPYGHLRTQVTVTCTHQRDPRSHVHTGAVICARKWRSHVHTCDRHPRSHVHTTTLGMGWGGVITFMFLCTHRHSNLIIFLAAQQTKALTTHPCVPLNYCLHFYLFKLPPPVCH